MYQTFPNSLYSIDRRHSLKDLHWTLGLQGEGSCFKLPQKATRVQLGFHASFVKEHGKQLHPMAAWKNGSSQWLPPSAETHPGKKPRRTGLIKS